MLDRFLFRVWDRSYGKMIYSGVVGNHKLAIGLDGKIYGFDYDENNIGDNNSDIGEYPERFEIMQCTGLKDKNSRLVFEDDKVRIQQNGLSNLTVNAVVKYEMPECGFYLHTEFDEWLSMAEFGSDIEIIGNIHDTAPTD